MSEFLQAHDSSSNKSSTSHYMTAPLSASDVAPTKKVKKNAALPSSLMAVFAGEDGSRAGPQVDIPVTATVKQLETLVNTMLSNDEAIPYAFYVNNLEVVSSLEETLQNLAAADQLPSTEATVQITFQPLSIFRVRPVSRCSETMTGHSDAVLHVSYSPDGTKLASGGGDMAVRFWNVSSSMPQHTCVGHKNHVLCTAWSQDSATFVSADKSGEIRLWDPKTGTQKGAPLKGHKKWVTHLCYEPFHLDSGCVRLASSSKDTTIKIWNTKTGLCETTISGHSDSVECLRWGGTGMLYTCSRDREIKVWAVDGSGRSMHKLVRTLSGHAHRINSLALNCDYVLRTGPFELTATYAKDEAPSPKLDLKELKKAALGRYNAVVAVSGEILVSGSDDFTLILWKPTEDKKPVTRMTGHQQLINHTAFSPDGRYLASASFDKKVKLWCGKTGRFIATLNGHVASVYQVSWSADSVYLVSASKDSTIKLWSMKDTKKAHATLPGHEDEVYSLDWSPNGTQVASGSKDRTIKIWRS